MLHTHPSHLRNSHLPPQLTCLANCGNRILIVLILCTVEALAKSREEAISNVLDNSIILTPHTFHRKRPFTQSDTIIDAKRNSEWILILNPIGNSQAKIQKLRIWEIRSIMLSRTVDTKIHILINTLKMWKWKQYFPIITQTPSTRLTIT